MTAVATPQAGPLSQDKDWQATKKALKDSLQANLALMHSAKASEAEQDQAYQNALQNVHDIRAHAVNGLRIIDRKLASGELNAEITTLSQQATAEAEKIKLATAKIQQLTGLVDLLRKLVGLFSLLP